MLKPSLSGSLPCLPEAAETDRLGGNTISWHHFANTVQEKFSGSLCQGLPETYRYDLKAIQSAKVSNPAWWAIGQAFRKEAWWFERGKVRGRAGMLISIRDIVD